MPGFIKPQLATLKSRAPKGDHWLHEIKYDGYRVQVHLDRGRKKVFTRNRLDWTKRFTEIAGALAIPGEAIIDGEMVVVHEGRTNFSELQAELAAGRQGRLVYYAFDLLWRNGDLETAMEIERLWNELTHRLPFFTVCTYPTECFAPSRCSTHPCSLKCLRSWSCFTAERPTPWPRRLRAAA